MIQIFWVGKPGGNHDRTANRLTIAPLAQIDNCLLSRDRMFRNKATAIALQGGQSH